MQDPNDILQSAMILSPVHNSQERENTNQEMMDITSITLSSQTTMQGENLALQTSCNFDPLINISARLCNDVACIQQWKVAAELENQQKGKMEKELQAVIQNQHKSVLDLQLENKKLSTKLQEETSNRELILHRLDTNISLCNVLRAYVEKLDERMKNCEANDQRVKSQQERHRETLRFLKEGFETLKDVHASKKESWKSKLNKETEERQQMKSELSAKLSELSNENDELRENVQMKIDELEASRDERSKLDDQLEHALKDSAELNAKLSTSEAQQLEMRNEADGLITRNDKLKNAVQSLTKRLGTREEELKQDLKTCQDELSATIVMQTMQLSILAEEKAALEEKRDHDAVTYRKALEVEKQLAEELQEKSQQLTAALETARHELETRIAAHHDVEEGLKNELQLQTSTLESNRDELKAKIDLYEDIKQANELEIENLRKQLCMLKDETDLEKKLLQERLCASHKETGAVTKQFNESVQLLKEFEEQTRDEINKLNALVVETDEKRRTEMATTVDRFKKSEADLAASKGALEAELSRTANRLAAKEKEVDELEEALAKSKAENDESVEKHEAEARQLKSEIVEFETIVASVTAEKLELTKIVEEKEVILRNVSEEHARLCKNLATATNEKDNQKTVLDVQIADYKETVSCLEAQRTSLRETVTELQAEAAKTGLLSNEVALLKQKVTEQRMDINQKQDELANWKVKMEDLQREISRLTHAKDQVVIELGNYRIQKDLEEEKLKKIEGTLRKDLQKSSQKVKTLINEAKQKTEKWREELNVLKLENEQLKLENEKFKTALSNDKPEKRKSGNVASSKSSVPRQKLTVPIHASPAPSESSIADYVDFEKLSARRGKSDVPYQKKAVADIKPKIRGTKPSQASGRFFSSGNKVAERSRSSSKTFLDDDVFMFPEDD